MYTGFNEVLLLLIAQDGSLIQLAAIWANAQTLWTVQWNQKNLL